MTPSFLLADDGTVIALDVARWHDRPTSEEDVVLDHARAPVVDLGCGPGRHLIALGERGIPAMGVDAAPSAVSAARDSGALVLERSIFERIPGTRRWGTVLLLDGNIGIGGDPVALLRRAAQLLRPDGIVLAEIASPGVATQAFAVSLVRGSERSSPFPWAQVGMDGLPAVASAAGLRVEETWRGGDRWFSQLAIA